MMFLNKAMVVLFKWTRRMTKRYRVFLQILYESPPLLATIGARQ